MRIDLDNYQEVERDKSFGYAPRKKRRKKHVFFKFLIAIALSLAVVLFVAYLTIKFFVGPLVKTVDGLPDNFPQELAIYSLESASIDLQNPEGRQKVINGLRAMPDWVLNLFLNVLSDNLRLRLAENFGDEINVPKNFSIDDLKNALKTINLEDTSTINLSWINLSKTKEELAAFYKQKLAEADFEFKESLGDYEINLGFWKNDIFGTMSFADDKKEDAEYKSDVNITVNYFDQFKQ